MEVDVEWTASLPLSKALLCTFHIQVRRFSSINSLLLNMEGIYLVSTSIAMYYNTQIVGCMDPLTDTTPSILASSSFTGFGVLSSDVYLPGGQSEWYIEQASGFYLRG